MAKSNFPEARRMLIALGADPDDPALPWPTDNKPIPDWIAKITDLRKDVVEWPLRSFKIHPMGAHGAWRGSPKDGWCPYRGGRKKNDDPAIEAQLRAGDYPCKHYGADLSAPKGTPVYAPHDGWILYSGPATAPPFVGYQPGAVLLAHHDTQDSVWQRIKRTVTQPLVNIWGLDEGTVALRYSLIGHVTQERPDLPIDVGVPKFDLAADVWDSTSSKPNKAHWRKADDGTIVMMSGADGHDNKRWVNAGDQIGYVGLDHIHWEIRNAPLAGKSGRFDPIATWQQFYAKPLPDGTEPTPPDVTAQPEPARGGGILALLGLLLLSDNRKKRRRR